MICLLNHDIFFLFVATISIVDLGMCDLSKGLFKARIDTLGDSHSESSTTFSPGAFSSHFIFRKSGIDLSCQS